MATTNLNIGKSISGFSYRRFSDKYSLYDYVTVAELRQVQSHRRKSASVARCQLKAIAAKKCLDNLYGAI